MISLAVLVFKGQGPAYAAIHLAGMTPDLEVLEMIPMGDEAQILVKGPKASLQAWMAHPEQKTISAILVEKWNEKIERAFYSLDSAALLKSLLVVEGKSLGSLFQAAASGIEQGWQIVDLKIPRGSVKWGVLTMTSDQTEIGAESTHQWVGSELQINLITNASSALRRYFDIEA